MCKSLFFNIATWHQCYPVSRCYELESANMCQPRYGLYKPTDVMILP